MPHSIAPHHAAALILVLLAIDARAAEPAADAKAVAAKVNGEAITVGEVRREMERALGGRKVADEDLPRVQTQALVVLVDRRLALKTLAEDKIAANPAEIKFELDRIAAQLQRQKVKLDEYLTRAGLDEPGFRRELTWQLTWKKFLEKQLSDANLQKHFAANVRDFDGREIHVAHILLKVPEKATEQDYVAAEARAKKAREEIASGKLTFATAAAQYSQAPTANAGGDLGFIRRREPMPELFTQAAFALAKGELSPPVRSKFGVHLIQCVEIKPGQRSWEDCREELTQAVTAYLFRWAADRSRAAAKIEYTDAWPHP